MPDLIDAVDGQLYLNGERCSGLNTYGLSMFAYHGAYIGLQWFFRVTDTHGFYACHGGPMDGRLLFSRDAARQWQIPTRQFALPRGEKGEWDWGMICGIANRPVLSPDGREWWYYYGGWQYGHGTSRRRACIGLAKLRVDGFASIDSPDSEGALETPPLSFTGDRLVLNVNAAGRDTEGAPNYAQVEVLDADGHTIEGHAQSDCDAIQIDSVEHVVTWCGRAGLGRLAGRPIRLRILLRGAELYSFQFHPAEP